MTDGTGANYLSGFSYNAAGQPTGDSLGNGVAETFGFDSNRLQLTSQTATRNGGPQYGLMNLTYNYQASAGQMGAGSTAGNSGQLMTISGTINSMTESAAHTYDNVGRLITSNQTSNGSSAQRRFAYDRWGNRTSVWDAASGGVLIQNISLAQSGGVPTNQIAAVSTPGWYGTYSYDTAGNLTNDGVHSYQYDAENRIISVDGGSTAQYSYDQENRRYKKSIGSVVTHYVWEDGQVIGEHDANGAAVAEYIYSYRRMIAKAVSGVMQYYLMDRLSERLVLDSSGNVTGRMAHLPFGEDFATGGSQEKHRFTNYERDSESGADYAINRQYSQSVGRFGQADPYQAANRMTDPQTWNRYSYSRNDPICFSDPEGLNLAYLSMSAAQAISDWYFNIVNISAGGQSINPIFWGGGTTLGGGSSSTPNNGGSVEPGGDTGSRVGQKPDPKPAVDKGIQDAETVLANASAECKALFNGKDPAALLKELKEGNRIKATTSYRQYDEKTGKNVTSDFDVFTVGIAPQVKGALGQVYPIIYLNLNGAYFTGKIQMINTSGPASEFFGIKPKDVSAFIILHELEHASGKIHNHGEEQKFNNDLRDKCFPKK